MAPRGTSKHSNVPSIEWSARSVATTATQFYRVLSAELGEGEQAKAKAPFARARGFLCDCGHAPDGRGDVIAAGFSGPLQPLKRPDRQPKKKHYGPTH